MITSIRGKVVLVEPERVLLEAGAFEYEVLVPDFVRRAMQMELGKSVKLFTIEYLEGNPAQGRLIPRIVGFRSEVEREFFELFCSVDGVGTRKALRAMVQPVRDVATLIEEQSVKGLSALPGIGPASAERIIAKLRRKMPKFALLVERDMPGQVDAADRDLVRETFDILVSLGHSETDARRMLDSAVAKQKKFKDVDELLRVVYDRQGS